MAYVVPQAERLHHSEPQVDQADGDKRVAQWKMAFDLAYRAKSSDPGPSFAGWKSSYTNKPLPDAEMQEWLRATVDRIMSLEPKHVLEIGCGVGLLVQAIAPRCVSYRGSDLSPIAVARLADFAASKTELSHVRLCQGEAADLRTHPSSSVDTVILNSVVQYFPTIGYLRSVITEAVRVVQPGGHIFIGDVRHADLLRLFHGAVQLAMAPPDATVQWLKQRVFLAVEQERELAIDPRFFLALPDTDPRLGSVEVLLKRGHAHNEMTRYRYDVILYVGPPRSAPSHPAVEWPAQDHAPAAIVAQCEARSFTSAVIRNVPNRRLASDIAALQALRQADGRQRVGSFRESFSAHDAFGHDPEDFWALADRGVCSVRIGWSSASDGSFDVTLAARDLGPVALPLCKPSDGCVAPVLIATDPLGAAARQRLGTDLHQWLRDNLPESDVPAAVIAVDTFPPLASEAPSHEG